MARFTLPRDLYHGKGALEALKSFKGERAMICVGGGSMKRFGFLDRAIGYLKEAGSFMTDAERAYLYDAIRLLPFELGLRFFQDYLAGDKYFKVRQPGQNLNRARVQFRLCEAIEARERSIREILAKL